MQESKRNQLEAKLKRMLKQLDQAEAKQKQPANQSGVGNVVRRRAGQKDKRFSI